MDKKIALITGGNRGIGSAICKKLAQEGYYVCINSRTSSNAKALLDEIIGLGGEGEIIEFDVTSYEQVNNAAKAFKYDKLDVLINNAGTLKDNLIYEVEAEDWNRTLATNYFGAVTVHNAFLEKLKLSEGAAAINICSISGVKPRKGQLSYAVSKSMLIEWTKQMGMDNKALIRYYAISPGPVATDLIKQSPWYNDPKSKQRVPLGRYAEPEEIASFISFLAGNGDVFANGSNIILDGGFIQTTKDNS